MPRVTQNLVVLLKPMYESVPCLGQGTKGNPGVRKLDRLYRPR